MSVVGAPRLYLVRSSNSGKWNINTGNSNLPLKCNPIQTAEHLYFWSGVLAFEKVYDPAGSSGEVGPNIGKYRAIGDAKRSEQAEQVPPTTESANMDKVRFCPHMVGAFFLYTHLRFVSSNQTFWFYCSNKPVAWTFPGSVDS